MKFFVIGSNSFSGSSFIHYLLKKGHSVTGVSRSAEEKNIFLKYKSIKSKKNFSFYRIDINKNLNSLIKLIKQKKPSYIINFAAQGMVAESWKNPNHWYKTNLLSQVVFHDELRKLSFIKKYIQFTTPEVYGSTTKWIKENNNFAPSTPYAVSRAACDLHLISFKKAYDFPVIFTRAANVFGPSQQLYRIVPRTILFSKLNKQLILDGGGSSIRSFIHIDDVSNALYKIIKKGKVGSTYHISTKETVSIRKLVKIICDMTNSKFNNFVKIEKDRLGKDQAYLLDSSKLRSELNWNDTISLENGLNDTIRWIETNFAYIKKLSLDYKHKV